MKLWDFKTNRTTGTFTCEGVRFHTALHNLGVKLEKEHVDQRGLIIKLDMVWTVKKMPKQKPTGEPQ